MADLFATKEYVDTNFDLRDRALSIEKAAREEALRLATGQLEGRLEKLNKLRGNVLTRDEHETFEKDVYRRVEALERWQSKLLGISVVGAVLAAIIGAMVMRLING